MDLLTIDFETYYSSSYSLSKITTEEYIRSKEFEVIGVAVKRNDEPTKWYSGAKEEVALWLRGFDWEHSMMLAHNTTFDGAIMNMQFGFKPKALADTLSMARALHGTEVGGSLKALAEHYGVGVKGDAVLTAIGMKRESFTPAELAAYGEYCCNDVELTYEIFHKMLPAFPIQEMKLVDLTLRMFTEPKLVLHTLDLIEHLKAIHEKKSELMSNVSVQRDTLMSNPKFAEWLEHKGVEVPMKISATTGRETYAFSKTDDGFKALLDHPDLEVQAMVAARLGVKSTLEETRTQRFIDISSRGLIPVPLRYYAAHTGRWGGDDKVNLQNLPRTSPLKKCIMAPPGYVIIDSDSSQIEARTLAWLAEQEDLVQGFAAGEDVYRKTASAIYNKPPDHIVPHPERFVGKTTVLGAGYGMGGAKFQRQLRTFNLDLELAECERIVAVYRETYPRIPALWKQAQRALEAMVDDQTVSLGRPGVLEVHGRKGIKLPNGMYLRFPNLRRHIKPDGSVELVYDSKRGKAVLTVKIYGAKLIENICQALARIIIGEQLVMISKRYAPVLTVHDAIASLAPEEEAEEAVKFVVATMKTIPDWATGLPLNCEAGMGKTYGDC